MCRMQMEKLFEHRIDVGAGLVQMLRIPIQIPFEQISNEFVQRLIRAFHLPQYIKNDLQVAIDTFIRTNTEIYYDQLIDNVLNEPHSIPEANKFWDTIYREGTTTYCEHLGQSDEEVFGMAYHKLVHSSVLEAILQIEHSYAQGVRDCVHLQDEQINFLTSKQMAEMSEAVAALDITTSEQKINDLAIQHFDDHSLLQAKWSSELNTMKEVQRREFRNWIMTMLEEHASTVSPLRSPRMSFALPVNSEKWISTTTETPEETLLEESFTIHLGSQMKQMYNIRLLSADVTDFCRINATSNSPHNSPQRLQTAMSLYSNDLCGLVLLIDNNLGFTNITKEFMSICQQSTEFHFAHVEDQMENIGECVKGTQAYQRRAGQQSTHDKYLCIDWQTAVQWSLRTGDVFMTRHSNLSKVHVVFHLMVDSSLRLSDINSRHKVILGLRNILKMACSNNITTLTIPLLLQHEMTEEMTVQWCTKRAELIFKCVKGFMIEMASWGGSELKNLQFLIPKGISTAVFGSLATMLPSIFKLSNPVIFKAINQKNS